MNYGLYLSATGVLSNLHKQDVMANNLANVETIAFKPDAVMTRQRAPERIENGTLMTDPQWLLEKLGGGHFVEPSRTVFTQGGLQRSSGELDLAIEGDGFLAVRSGPAPEDIRLTRDGRLTINDQQQLVMVTSGLPVLDTTDQPITLSGDGPLDIDRRGVIRQSGAVVAELQLTDAPRDRLTKAGMNLYRLDGSLDERRSAGGAVRQGFVEQSAVEPIIMLNKLIAATKAAQGNTQLMQYHDFLTGQAVTTFGRVA